MTADQLRKSILQQAIQGKLVPQDPNDEPASVLLERIREEKARLIKEKKAKREKNPSRIFRGEDNSYYEEFTATGEVRCIDDEIPFDLPDGWVWTRFGVVTSFSVGKTPERGEQAYWTNGEYPWVSISDMIPTGRISRTKELISQYASSQCFRKVAPAGSLLMSFKLTIGRTSILQMDAYHNEAIISISLFADPNEAFRNYLLYTLPLISNMGDSKDAIKGKTLNCDSIYALLLPLPPLAEQERIVAKIEELMPWVEQYGKAQSELDQLNNSIQGRLRKSVLQYAIEGKLVPQQAEDGSAEELLAEIQAEKQRLYAAGKLKKKDLAHSTIFRAEDGKYYEQVEKTITCIDEEIPFDLPESWRWVRICQLFFVTKLAGFEYTKYFTKDTISESNEIPIVRAKNVRMGWFKENVSERIPKRLSDLLQRSKLDRPALLMTFIGAGIGDVCIFQSEYEHHLAPNVAKLEPYFSVISLPYILVALMSPVGQLGVDAIKKSTAQPSLSMATIRGMLIPLPPLAEQQRIVSKLEEVISVLNRLGQ